MERHWLVLIAAAAALTFLFLLIGIIRRARRRCRNRLEGRLSELRRSGEATLIEPQPGSFRGASSGLSCVKCDGFISLTGRRLIFQRLFGHGIEITLPDVTAVLEQKTFLAARRKGRTHLVLRIGDGSEIGFFVRDVGEWKRLLEQARRTGNPIDGPDAART